MNLLPNSDDSAPADNDGFTDADDLLNPGNSTGDELRCETCGTPLTYGGRGRKPRFCADHKPTRAVSKRSTGTNVDVLIGQMTEMYAGIGGTIGMFPPLITDGMMVSASANALAESWRPLIMRDSAVRKFWEKVCTGGGWGAVIMAHGFLALGIMRAHNVTIPGFGNTNAAEREPIE